MGDMADWAEEQAFKEMAMWDSLRDDADRIIRKYMMGVCVWTTRDGKEIPVVKMENSHIINSYMMVKKSDDPRSEAWKEIFEAEMFKREIKP